MAYITPQISYTAPSGSTIYSLTGAQSVSISRGKVRIQDPFQASSCTIELVPPASFTVAPQVGGQIRVHYDTSLVNNTFFVGVISDVQRRYDIPYNSTTGVGAGDRMTITCMGILGLLSQGFANGSFDGQSVGDAIFNLAPTNNIASEVAPNTSAGSLVKTGTLVNENALTAVSRMANTAVVGLDDAFAGGLGGSGFAQMVVLGYNRGQYRQFADDGSLDPDGLTSYKYTALEFASNIQNTVTQVNVTGPGITDQVTSTGSKPFTTLEWETYCATNADGASLSGYLVNMLSGQVAPAPFRITTNTLVSSYNTGQAQIVGLCIMYNGLNQFTAMGQGTRVKFRGNTLLGVITGIEMNFYPDYASVSLYLSPSLGQPFILDSTAFGVLNTNRLGYP